MDAQGIGDGKSDGREILPRLRERKRDIVLHMPCGKEEQRQHDNGIGPLSQIANGYSQRRAGQLHIAVGHVKIGARRTIGRDNRLELDICVGIAAPMADDEQSRAHVARTGLEETAKPGGLRSVLR